MKTRRSFLSAFAALPFIGRLTGSVSQGPGPLPRQPQLIATEMANAHDWDHGWPGVDLRHHLVRLETYSPACDPQDFRYMFVRSTSWDNGETWVVAEEHKNDLQPGVSYSMARHYLDYDYPRAHLLDAPWRPDPLMTWGTYTTSSATDVTLTTTHGPETRYTWAEIEPELRWRKL